MDKSSFDPQNVIEQLKNIHVYLNARPATIKDLQMIHNAIILLEEFRDSKIWQPIETAPKNERILVVTPLKTIFTAIWVKNPYTDDEAFCIVKTTDEDTVICHPTHWQHLPPPPKDSD